MPARQGIFPFLAVLFALCSSVSGLEHSVAPIAGYSPTYSLALGGGYFFKGEDVSGRFIAIYTLSNAFQFQPRLEVKFVPWFIWETDMTFQKGFEPYFGEGPNTSVKARKDFPAFRSESTTGTRFQLGDTFSLAPRVGLRTYHALHSPSNPFNPSGPRLVSPAVGANIRWDLRGKDTKQDEGFFQDTDIWVSPRWSEVSRKVFATVETRFTEGLTLFSDIRLVWTGALGVSLGEPDYAFRFHLGGSSKLRGYLDNRFRGKYFYLQATELRIPLSGMFALAFFAEAGEATDSVVRLHPKFCYGTGLRIALPPDRVQWARIDVGFGQDSWALYADFGLPF